MPRSPTLTDRLFAKFETRIVSGDMPAGSRFPSQKEIAESENVSRTVVREAVARLEAHGFAVSRQGSGVYVPDTVRYRAFQVTREELSELSDVVKLLEMRLAIETEMAALAALRRTTGDIAAMREALSRMSKVSDDPTSSAEADADFHMTIAKATQNPYYLRLIDFLGVRLVPPRSLYLRDRPAPAHAAYVEKVHAEHESIIDAIVRKDQARARNAARRHMLESLKRHTELSEQLEGSRAARRKKNTHD